MASVLLLMVCSACNSELAPDCFQNAGDLVRDEVTVPDFNTITVFENITLELQQGPERKVEVETGRFLREEVSVTVENGRLLLKDTNDCNFVRPYGLTKVFVTAPDITEIRSSTGWPITSKDTLSFPNLLLISESFINMESETTDGSFDLVLATENLRILVNGITFFKLRGTTTNLRVEVAAGDSRIEADDLISQNVEVNHRGSNDILIDARNSIQGVLRATGDVISRTRPPSIDVDIQYKGELLFLD